jgi:hypothetical protein
MHKSCVPLAQHNSTILERTSATMDGARTEGLNYISLTHKRDVLITVRSVPLYHEAKETTAGAKNSGLPSSEPNFLKVLP